MTRTDEFKKCGESCSQFFNHQPNMISLEAMKEKQTVSALKFRPQTFSQIVGQKHITRALQNSLDKGRMAHAYLFSGTRGVGKTTTARILAKAFNCKNGPTSTPCLECDNCREITQGTSMDVMEIDGASNRGIDSIRDLKEKVMFAPTKSRNKVYIIDEVHQITKEAFNALLKTLEEPPPHVIFIFATTELAKVPDTIMSRCQCYEYKAISLNEITAQLTMIAENEKITVEPSAVDVIARRARGSMRDAESMFDQAIAYGGGAVTEDDVKMILGLVDKSTLLKVIDAVVKQDGAGLLGLLESVAQSGADPGMFLEDMSAVTRNMVTAKLSPASLAGYEPAEKEKLVQWAGELDFDEIQRYFEVITRTIERVKFSSQPELVFEMGVLRLLEQRGLARIDDLLDKVNRAQTVLERDMPPPVTRGNSTSQTAQTAQSETTPDANPVAPLESNVEPAPASIQQSVSGQGQKDLLSVFMSARPRFMGIFEHAQIKINPDTVTVAVDNMYNREQIEDPENKRLLEKLATEHLGRKIRLVVEYHTKDDKPSSRNSAKQKREMKKKVMDTPIIQEAMDIFQGDIVDFKLPEQG